jgi:hypothetical protein
MLKSYKNNVVFISSTKRVELICNVCEYVARDREDLQSIQQEGSCTECITNFKHQSNVDWKKGIRPTRAAARARMNIFIEEV